MSFNPELNRRFTSRTPDANTSAKHELVRHEFIMFVASLDDLLPDGREKSIAMTELENASMWAQKAVATSSPNNVQ